MPPIVWLCGLVWVVSLINNGLTLFQFPVSVLLVPPLGHIIFLKVHNLAPPSIHLNLSVYVPSFTLHKSYFP